MIVKFVTMMPGSRAMREQRVGLRLTRRRLLVLAPAGLLLAACGRAVETSTPRATAAETTRPGAASPAAAPTAASATAVLAATAVATVASGTAQPKATGAASTVTTIPAATAAATASANTGSLAKVRVGYVPVLIYGPLFVAIEKGYFREAGIESVLTPLVGGADIISQTVAGNFEVGLGGMGAAALNAAKRNLDFRIVASHHAESPPLSTPLVVAKKKKDDGTYKTVADLKGKKVAVNARGSATEYWLNAALTKAGLTLKDIELVALPFDQVAAALEGGALDGALLGEPLVTLAEQKGLVARLSDDYLVNAQGTVIFYNLRWMQAEPALAEQWLTAWLRGARDLQGDGYSQEANAAIIEKYTKVPKDVVKVAKPPRHDPNGRLNLEDMRAQQEFFLKTGSLTYTDLIDLTTIIDTSFADRAVTRLGRQ
jgi:NitT/TauT family transport system substrate-binding protein